MHTTSLRKVGGSVMLAVPPALLDLLKIGTGTKVDMNVRDGRLVIEPRSRPNYTLEELLSRCQEEHVPSAVHEGNCRFARSEVLRDEVGDSRKDYLPPAEDRDWLEAKPVGEEII